MKSTKEKDALNEKQIDDAVDALHLFIKKELAHASLSDVVDVIHVVFIDYSVGYLLARHRTYPDIPLAKDVSIFVACFESLVTHRAKEMLAMLDVTQKPKPN